MGWLGDWLSKIRQYRRSHGPEAVRARVDACLEQEVMPALEAVRDRLRAEGRDATLERGDDWITLRATNYNGLPLEYAVRGHVYREAVVNLSSLGGAGSASDLKHHGRIEVAWGGRRREFRLSRCSRAAIERAATRYYERFLMDSASARG